MKRLFRSRTHRMLAGICGGIAEYVGADPTVIRVAWVLFSLFWGAGVLAYLIFWLIIPEAPFDQGEGPGR